MSLANIKILKEHFESLINGKVKTGNSTRDALIVSDATRNLQDIKTKFPALFEEGEKPKEEKVKPKEKEK